MTKKLNFTEADFAVLEHTHDTSDECAACKTDEIVNVNFGKRVVDSDLPYQRSFYDNTSNELYEEEERLRREERLDIEKQGAEYNARQTLRLDHIESGTK